MGSGMTQYQVSRAEVLRYLGYAGQAVDVSLDNRIDEAIARCVAASNPGFTYRVFPVDITPDGVQLVGTTLVLPGADILAHLAGARECAVMTATAGLGNEWELRRLSLDPRKSRPLLPPRLFLPLPFLPRPPFAGRSSLSSSSPFSSFLRATTTLR